MTRALQKATILPAVAAAPQAAAETRTDFDPRRQSVSSSRRAFGGLGRLSPGIKRAPNASASALRLGPGRLLSGPYRVCRPLAGWSILHPPLSRRRRQPAAGIQAPQSQPRHRWLRRAAIRGKIGQSRSRPPRAVGRSWRRSRALLRSADSEERALVPAAPNSRQAGHASRALRLSSPAAQPARPVSAPPAHALGSRRLSATLLPA